jgi:hypothetical protein
MDSSQELSLQIAMKPSCHFLQLPIPKTRPSSLPTLICSPTTTASFGIRFSYKHFARTQWKTACIVDEAYLPLWCLAIDLLLLRARVAGMCLLTRCPAMDFLLFIDIPAFRRCLLNHCLANGHVRHNILYEGLFSHPYIYSSNFAVIGRGRGCFLLFRTLVRVLHIMLILSSFNKEPCVIMYLSSFTFSHLFSVPTNSRTLRYNSNFIYSEFSFSSGGAGATWELL